MEPRLYTLAERPDLADPIEALTHLAWPEFMLHGDVDNWIALFETFQPYQLLFCDRTSGDLLAVGHTVPFVWDGTLPDLPPSISAIIQRAFDARDTGQPPNTFSALAAMVHPAQQGRGLSTLIIQQMKALAARYGCTSLIAPVRPTLKTDYPLIPLRDYIQWTRPDGQPFDPWLRVHLRLGAEILQVADSTMVIEAPVAKWEAWTGLTFPGSGHYLVPGALQPVAIDRKIDCGRYDDPNVWVRHAVTAEETRSVILHG
jgi:GNAT superfamily N-acetyltransferase